MNRRLITVYRADRFKYAKSIERAAEWIRFLKISYLQQCMFNSFFFTGSWQITQACKVLLLKSYGSCSNYWVKELHGKHALFKGERHLERSENRVFSEFFFSIKTTCHGKMFYMFLFVIVLTISVNFVAWVAGSLYTLHQVAQPSSSPVFPIGGTSGPSASDSGTKMG